VDSTPRFLQGTFPFTGKGLNEPYPLSGDLRYTVPDGAVAQTVYLRGGNSTGELICLVLMRDAVPMRLFPLGARSSVHVSLRVIEDLPPGSIIEVFVAAPEGLSGLAVVDLGLVEV